MYNMPPWISWTDVKRPTPTTRPAHQFQGAGMEISSNVRDIEIKIMNNTDYIYKVLQSIKRLFTPQPPMGGFLIVDSLNIKDSLGSYVPITKEAFNGMKKLKNSLAFLFFSFIFLACITGVLSAQKKNFIFTDVTQQAGIDFKGLIPRADIPLKLLGAITGSHRIGTSVHDKYRQRNFCPVSRH